MKQQELFLLKDFFIQNWKELKKVLLPQPILIDFENFQKFDPTDRPTNKQTDWQTYLPID